MAKPGKGEDKGPKSPTWEGRVIMQEEALEDLVHWVTSHPRTAGKVLDLIRNARKTPFEGKGKPEPLKALGSDVWSRRITQEHRLVYRVDDRGIDILQARYHY